MARGTELTGYWWNVDSQKTHQENDWAKLVVRRVLELAWVDDPDWFCVQEAHHYRPYGPSGNLLEMIRGATGWNRVFVPDCQYNLEDGTRSQGDDFTEGLATFSKLPVKSHRAPVLGTNPQAKGQGWRCEQHVVDTVLETENGDVTVGNTHLTVIRPHHVMARRREIAAFKDHVLGRDPAEPYVVGGDFNSLRFMPATLLLRRHLDLHTGSRDNPTWTYAGNHSHPLSFNLDYVGSPHGNRLKIENIQLLDRRGSDHTPLKVRCVLDKLMDEAAA